MTFTVLAVFLRLRLIELRLLDAMRPSAYGIFLMHYIFIIWLQYAVYDYCMAGRRQVRHRVRRHAGAELGGHGGCCEEFRSWRG